MLHLNEYFHYTVVFIDLELKYFHYTVECIDLELRERSRRHLEVQQKCVGKEQRDGNRALRNTNS